VSGFFSPIAIAAKIGMTLNIPAKPAFVDLDSVRVLQVVSNLIGNALKFTPTGGTVSLNEVTNQDEVEISVIDTGPEVPAESRTAVFDRFSQVLGYDPRSLGLGLYIAKSIVEAHGGRIWVSSHVGPGSTFTFTLPLHIPELTSH
jgi:signal transduction histidine kinase